MSGSPKNAPSVAPDRHLDLFCLQCGYNLRGLSGDPRRCPECGYLNPLGELALPAELIRKQLRQLEGGAAGCVAAVVVGLVALYLTLVNFACSVMLLVFSPVAWFVSARVFRESCLGRPGWKDALWRYHVYALAIVIPLLAVVLLIWSLPDLVPVNMRFAFRRKGAGLTALMWLPVFALVLIGGPWAQRRVRAIIEPLQRDVAVKLAKMELKHRLGRSQGVYRQD